MLPEQREEQNHVPVELPERREEQNHVPVELPERRVPNPKRVEAGKRAAEARRVKKAAQERLLAELQAGKTELRTEVDNESRPRGIAGTAAETNSLAEVPQPHPTPQLRRAPDWTPWIVGGLGLAGVVWFGHMQKRKAPLTGTAASPTAYPLPRDVIDGEVPRDVAITSFAGTAGGTTHRARAFTMAR